MKPEEIAAYIGAAAWAPSIIGKIREYIVKPNLRLIPNSFGEISYTSSGPIINFQMAFAVESKDLILDGLTVKVAHEDGEERWFQWHGLAETISQVSDATGVKEIVRKDQVPIAIKILTSNLLEKFVRFQEPRYHARDNDLAQPLIALLDFTRQQNPQNYAAEVLRSQPFDAAVRHRQDWFCWKEGRYDVTLVPSALQPFKAIDSRFSFSLSADNIATLRRNLPILRDDLEQIISNGRQTQAPWQWVNVQFRKMAT